MPPKPRHFLLRWPSLVAYLVLIILALGGGYAYLQYESAPVAQGTVPVQVFVVKKGQTIGSIGQALQSAGLIRSPLAFKFYVSQNNLSKKIQAGTFKVSPSMTTAQIAQNLTHGTLDVWVTLLEGWRREEMAAAIAKAYTDADAAFDEQTFLNITKNQEGFLYPDTYLLPLGVKESVIAGILTDTFNKKVTQGLATDITASGKSLNEVVTMASLVEREAKSETSRRMVAGILWKRLDAGWPLQVDATLQYAVGFDKVHQTWWEPPTALDIKVRSNYNTYTNTGLPPTPICAPSLSSIEAVLHPTQSQYWFYLTGNDNAMHYATTVTEHNQNIAKYLH